MEVLQPLVDRGVVVMINGTDPNGHATIPAAVHGVSGAVQGSVQPRSQARRDSDYIKPCMTVSRPVTRLYTPRSKPS